MKKAKELMGTLIMGTNIFPWNSQKQISNSNGEISTVFICSKPSVAKTNRLDKYFIRISG